MPLKRSTILVLSTIVVTFFGLSYFTGAYQPSYLTDLTRTLISNFPYTTTTTMASPISGFLDRADPYRHSTSEFQPPRSAIELAVLRNAPVETEGFTLAIFSSDSPSDNSKNHYAVDAFGRIHILKDKDSQGILTLAKNVLDLPKPERWRNTWELNQMRTSQPIDRILSPKSTLGSTPKGNYEEEYAETSVQGFDGRMRELKNEVEGLKELPDALFELTSVVLEGRKGEAENDEQVLGYVRNLLGDVF